jgi:hypothetical protein
MKPAALVTSLFLAAVAIAHLVRFVLAIPITAGDVTIPVWLSAFGFFVPGALAVWLWREQRASTP